MRALRSRYTSGAARTDGVHTVEAKGGTPVYGVPGGEAGVVALLLSVILWIEPRIKHRVSGIIVWHKQQHSVERGGMGITVEVNPQPAPTICTSRRRRSYVLGSPRAVSPNLNRSPAGPNTTAWRRTRTTPQLLMHAIDRLMR